ncbi:MAG: PD40 domain-containing protein [Armatimonadetes bacterium]|nr:PD40 domain-containing protein [Armatimonadota bacterium]
MTPYVSGELTIPPRGQTYRACLGLGASCDVGVALSIFDIAESSWSTSLVDVNVPLGCVEGSWSGAVFPPRVYLSAEDFWIPQGGSTKLHWSSTNATRVVRSSFGTTELEGVLDVAPTATTEYEITVEGLGGQASARTVVVVGDDTGEGRDSKGPTTLVSAPGTGEKANRASFAPSVSPDGRYVAFESDATNLVDEDTNAARDIFVYDQLGGRSGG